MGVTFHSASRHCLSFVLQYHIARKSAIWPIFGANFLKKMADSSIRPAWLWIPWKKSPKNWRRKLAFFWNFLQIFRNFAIFWRQFQTSHFGWKKWKNLRQNGHFSVKCSALDFWLFSLIFLAPTILSGHSGWLSFQPWCPACLCSSPRAFKFAKSRRLAFFAIIWPFFETGIWSPVWFWAILM